MYSVSNVSHHARVKPVLLGSKDTNGRLVNPEITHVFRKGSNLPHTEISNVTALRIRQAEHAMHTYGPRTPAVTLMKHSNATAEHLLHHGNKNKKTTSFVRPSSINKRLGTAVLSKHPEIPTAKPIAARVHIQAHDPSGYDAFRTINSTDIRPPNAATGVVGITVNGNRCVKQSQQDRNVPPPGADMSTARGAGITTLA